MQIASRRCFGQHGKARELDTVLDAYSILQDRGSLASLVLLGWGVEVIRLKKRTRKMK